MERPPRRSPSLDATPHDAAPAPAASPPSLALALPVAERAPGRWAVRLGAREVEASLDPSVDVALVREALGRGARVVVECGAEPVIVGALATRRAVEFGPDGSVAVAARRFEVTATERLTLRTARAYVDLKRADVEVYGNRVVTRAREVAKVLARLVSLN